METARIPKIIYTVIHALEMETAIAVTRSTATATITTGSATVNKANSALAMVIMGNAMDHLLQLQILL